MGGQLLLAGLHQGAADPDSGRSHGSLNQLGGALSGMFGNLSQLAMGLVAQFVPAAASATTGQIALNTAMDANPILLVISLLGMLVGAC